MICRYCDGHTKVTDTRKQGKGDLIKRRRACYSCGKRFTTYEEYYIRRSK
jgi:transcriptional repressor NrdR